METIKKEIKQETKKENKQEVKQETRTLPSRKETRERRHKWLIDKLIFQAYSNLIIRDRLRTQRAEEALSNRDIETLKKIYGEVNVGTSQRNDLNL